MQSLYRELAAKVQKDPRLTKRSTAKFDLSLLLYNAGESICQLWEAANRCLEAKDNQACDALRDAVEQLRPIFGERNEP